VRRETEGGVLRLQISGGHGNVVEKEVGRSRKTWKDIVKRIWSY